MRTGCHFVGIDQHREVDGEIELSGHGFAVIKGGNKFRAFASLYRDCSESAIRLTLANDFRAGVMCNVDANGNLTGTKIVSESKANSGLGAVAIKACEGAKIVPGLDNGKPVPGQFNLAVDFAMLVNPDEMAPGSHLKQREE